MKNNSWFKLFLILLIILSAFSFTACKKTEYAQENTLEIKNVYQDNIGNLHLSLVNPNVIDGNKGKNLEVKIGDGEWYLANEIMEDYIIASYYDDNYCYEDNLSSLKAETIQINIRISEYTDGNKIYLASDPLPNSYSYKVKESLAYTNAYWYPKIKSIDNFFSGTEIYPALIGNLSQKEITDDSFLKYNVYDINDWNILVGEETYKYLLYLNNNKIYMKEITLSYVDEKIIVYLNDVESGIFKIAASGVSSEDTNDINYLYNDQNTYQWFNINADGVDRSKVTYAPSANPDESCNEILSFFISKNETEEYIALYYRESFRIYF